MSCIENICGCGHSAARDVGRSTTGLRIEDDDDDDDDDDNYRDDDDYEDDGDEDGGDVHINYDRAF